MKKLARKKGGSERWGFVTLLSRVLKVRSIYLKRKVEMRGTSTKKGHTQKSLDFLGDGPAVRQKGKFYYQNPRSV